MLQSIIATIMICMGVASTTPFNNAEQKGMLQPKMANITNDYTLTVQALNQSTTNADVLGTGCSYYPNGKIYEYKWNMSNSNSYINVLGNAYQTQFGRAITTDNNEVKSITFIDNVDYITQVGLRTCTSFMLKLTPYNYNIDTESTITLNTQIETYTDINDIDFYAYELYYYRYIYYTPSANWDEFLGRQLAIETTNAIKQEIEDINNGFYYTLKTDLIQVGNNEMPNGLFRDTIELGLTPKTDNYYFIVYRPCCRFVYQTTEQTQPMKWNFLPRWQDAIVITGTNIIPDGTYEVVNIPGLMFEILGMPFAFVSQAFNLTLFPGTPYQLNIANLFLSIIAILVFVWIIKIFIKQGG